MTARAQSLVAGFRYPKIMIEPAQRELDGFVALLQSLGIVVTRPEPVAPKKGEPISYILTEFEPVFDAADFFRCGRDLFVIRSNVTNASGIEWLRRHLGDGYRIHEIESRCPNPMHIDTTILPLGPGKILINPEYIDVDRLPAVLKKWDILVAPPPDPIVDRMLKITSLCGKWLNMN